MQELQHKLLVESLPEFKYKFGDMSTNLMKYMLTFDNVETYLKPIQYNTKLKMNDVFLYGCKNLETRPGVVGRGLTFPRGEALESIKSILLDGTQDFVIIPMMYMKMKMNCKSSKGNPGRTGHLFYLLYNRVTSELERIDMKKYHIEGYHFKTVRKLIEKKNIKIHRRNRLLCPMA